MTLLSVVIPTVNIMLLVFLLYLLWQIRQERKQIELKEKEIHEKGVNIDNNYHHVVEEALGKERKIIEDAMKNASAIISDSKYVSDSSKVIIEQAMMKMLQAVQQASSNSSQTILTNHQKTLTQVSNKSVNDFQNVTKQFETDYQKQLSDFRNSLLPQIQKQVEDYKKIRIEKADQKINEVIKKVSEEVFNKSISTEDHKNLIIESLEKFKKEGIFD